MGGPIKATVEALRGALPRGRSLPDDVWARRHSAILVLLWAHAAAIPIYAVVMGMSALHTVIESSILPLAALVAGTRSATRLVRMIAASVGLLSASGILVHLSGGLIEMHFHFFVMVAVVALYQDWAPFLMAIAYVLLHHGIVGALDPRSVFNHPAALAHPWKWAAIHALFVSGISVACLVTWRLNEIMLDHRRAAEERLREESHVVETLNEVGKALAADLDLQSVVQHVTDAATELTNAAFGAFFYNVTDPDGDSYMLYTISGADRRAFEHLGMPRNTPLFSKTFSGEGVMRIGDVTKDERYGAIPPHHGMPKGHLPVRSYLAVPVRSRTDAIIGGLFFGHPDVDRFGDVEERLAVGIASHAAVAIDNASLYESERRARASSEEAQRRLEVMAEASRALSASLDLDRVLMGFAHAVAPAIADGCEVYLLDDDGAVEIAASSTTLTSEGENADAARRAVARRETIVGDTSVTVPLTRRGTPLGALVLTGASGSRRRLTERDASFVEELGRRVAIAIENTNLYSAQRTASETLQRSLLPEQLPAFPGLEMTARYVPGGPGVEIGGDWYDVITLADGSLGLAMGDVVGRGVGAASLMGQLRNALRAYAMDGLPPGEMLGRLNELMYRSDSIEEPMATLVYGVFQPESGTLRLASAGHPPPLVLSADGFVSFIDGTGGLPLGAVPGATYNEVITTIAEGGTLLLYTDGLVEDRHLSLDEGLRNLARAVEADGADLERLCDGLLARPPASAAADDVALLAVRTLPLGDRLHLRLPARPSVLKGLRTTLRRWLREAGANEAETYEILVAACEACTNAIQHGAVSSEHFEITAERKGDISITVRDTGKWRRPRLDAEGGRGLDIIREFTDEAEIARDETGTEVRLRRRLANQREVRA